MSDINKEIEEVAEKIEKSTINYNDKLFATIKKLGPEGLKKAADTLEDSDLEILKSALEEMHKAANTPAKITDAATGKKIVTNITESKIETQKADDDEDEKIVKEKNKKVRQQGDATPKGFDGQVIKAEGEVEGTTTVTAKVVVDPEEKKPKTPEKEPAPLKVKKSVDDIIEKLMKGRGPDKQKRKSKTHSMSQYKDMTVIEHRQAGSKYEKGSPHHNFHHQMARSKDKLDLAAQQYTPSSDFRGRMKKEAKEHEAKAKGHFKEMESQESKKRSAGDQEIQDAARRKLTMKQAKEQDASKKPDSARARLDEMHANNQRLKEKREKLKNKQEPKMKKSNEELLALKDKVIEGFEKDGTEITDELVKGKMKELLIEEITKSEADPEVVEKSMGWDPKNRLAANTLGRNFHFSVNDFYDEMIKAVNDEESKAEDLKKSEAEPVDLVKEEEAIVETIKKALFNSPNYSEAKMDKMAKPDETKEMVKNDIEYKLRKIKRLEELRYTVENLTKEDKKYEGLKDIFEAEYMKCKSEIAKLIAKHAKLKKSARNLNTIIEKSEDRSQSDFNNENLLKNRKADVNAEVEKLLKKDK